MSWLFWESTLTFHMEEKNPLLRITTCTQPMIYSEIDIRSTEVPLYCEQTSFFFRVKSEVSKRALTPRAATSQASYFHYLFSTWCMTELIEMFVEEHSAIFVSRAYLTYGNV